MLMYYHESQRNMKHAIVMNVGKRCILFLVVAVHIVQNYMTSGSIQVGSWLRSAISSKTIWGISDVNSTMGKIILVQTTAVYAPT